MTDKKCWTKCLQDSRCQSVVMRRRECDLKGTASEHLIVALPKAQLIYPWSSRELSVPYLGWNDPGALSMIDPTSDAVPCLPTAESFGHPTWSLVRSAKAPAGVCDQC